MATSLLAMNAVFGRFFDVLPVEAADPAAFKARTGDAVFIFDVQLHYVGAGYDPTNAEAGRKGAVTKQALLGLRRQSRRMNPKLAARRRHPRRSVVGELRQGGVPRQRDGDRADLDAARALSAGGGGAARRR